MSSFRLNELGMGISVESRIHRTLRRLNRFKACNRWDQLPQLDRIYSPFEDNERLLGAYENVPGRLDHLMLFTNLRTHFWEHGRWRSLKYSDIEGCDWPPEGKNEAHTLVVRLKTGAYERLPVLGATEFGRDLFGVMRFFDRVVEDIK